MASEWNTLLEQPILNERQRERFDEWITIVRAAGCSSFQLVMMKEEWRQIFYRGEEITFSLVYGTSGKRNLFHGVERDIGKNGNLQFDFDLGQIETHAKSYGFKTKLKRDIIRRPILISTVTLSIAL